MEVTGDGSEADLQRSAQKWEPQSLQGSGGTSEGALITGASVLEPLEAVSLPELIPNGRHQACCPLVSSVQSVHNRPCVLRFGFSFIFHFHAYVRVVHTCRA